MPPKKISVTTNINDLFVGSSGVKVSKGKTTQKCSGVILNPSPYTKEQLKERSRNFCLTTWDAIPIRFSDEMKFLAYAQETCKTTQKLHWQTYVCLYNDKTLGAAIKYFAKLVETHPHVEIMRGSLSDNEKYCSKEGELIKHGTEPEQGRRTDLYELRDRIQQGTTVDEICLENPVMVHQYGRTLDRIEDIVKRRQFRNFMTTCDWRYGPTGSNKSGLAYENFDPKTHYVLNVSDNGYWEGYEQQEIVVINEFRGQIPYGQLLDLIDQYPASVKRRNRAPIPFMSKHIIITSSLSPQECYRGVLSRNDDINQLLRRVNIVQHQVMPDIFRMDVF